MINCCGLLLETGFGLTLGMVLNPVSNLELIGLIFCGSRFQIGHKTLLVLNKGTCDSRWRVDSAPFSVKTQDHSEQVTSSGQSQTPF